MANSDKSDEIKATVSAEEYHINSHPNHDFVMTSQGLSRIMTSDTHVHMGGMTFDKQEFLRAFEGTLNPGLTVKKYNFGSPAPLAISSYCLTMFLFSLVNCGARGLSNSKAFIGLTLFYAGFVEILGGFWCILFENAWGGTMTTAFGAFWFSYGMILIDAWGCVSSYAENMAEFYNAMGFFLMAWAIFAFIMFSLTFRSTWVLFLMIFFIAFNLTLLSAAQFCMASGLTTAYAHLTKAGGVVGVLASVLGWYSVYEGLATKENSVFVPPVLLMPTAVIAGAKKQSDESNT